MSNSKHYMTSDSTDGNQVIDAGIGYDDALRTAQSHANRTRHDWYLYEQGASEDDYMTISPSAESIHANITATELLAASGCADVGGGNAVDDCDALYDGDTIHTTHAADGISHDDHERVRLVIGSRPSESIGSAAQLLELIDRAVSSGRLPEDDRDAAYRACCEHLGVDA